MHDEMQPQDELNAGAQMLPSGEPDHEGAMARADLYKLANYSVKLFKKLNDQDQLEGWVQAKITKAADYIASVYHYLEYEMEFSEYGKKIENSDMYSESEKADLKNKLTEAKEKLKALKVAQAEKIFQLDESKKKCTCDDTKESHESCAVHGKMEEGFSDTAKVGDTLKTQHGTATKTKTGVVHKREAKPEDDEDYVPPKKEKKTAMTGAERREQKAKDKEQEKASKAYEKKHPGSVKRYVDGKLVNEGDKGDMDHDGEDEPDSKEYMDNKDAAIKKAMAKKGKKVDEAAKPDYIDLDKDGNKKEPMKKAAKDAKTKKVDEAAKCNHTPKGEKCPVHGLKECGSMYEESKPSAGMTKKEKSAVVKKAKAGGDIGKPGKGFKDVEAAAKKGGAKDPKAVAAAAMWKQAKKKVAESIEQVVQPEGELDLGEGNMTDQQYMDALNKLRSTPEGQAKLAAALNSKDPNALNKLVGFQLSKGEKTTPMVVPDEGPTRPLRESVEVDEIKKLSGLL